MNEGRGLTAEDGAGVRDDILDVDRRLFCFGCNIAASSYHDERVCLAVGVLQVEPAKEDSSSRYYALPKAQFLA